MDFCSVEEIRRRKIYPVNAMLLTGYERNRITGRKTPAYAPPCCQEGTTQLHCKSHTRRGKKRSRAAVSSSGADLQVRDIISGNNNKRQCCFDHCDRN
jgi:hypothetical protein